MTKRYKKKQNILNYEIIKAYIKHYTQKILCLLLAVISAASNKTRKNP